MINTPFWIVHGAWDVSIFGGVPVDHSRQMSRFLSDLSVPHRYTEVPECGHDCMRPDILKEVLPWLSRQRRNVFPEAVNLTVHTLRHNSSHYISVHALERYGPASHIEARIHRDKLIINNIENVAAFTAGPVPDNRTYTVYVEDKDVGAYNLSIPVSFHKEGHSWEPGGDPPSTLKSGTKHRGCAGPVGDIFFEPLRIIKGTRGGPEENFILEQLARQWADQFKKRNGGIHRGVFDGESHYRMQVIDDTECTPWVQKNCNLILAGTQKSNRVLKSIAGTLPVRFTDGGIELQGKTYVGSEPGACVIHPSPFNPDRYIVVVGGSTPRGAAGSSHFGFQLVPDYLIWDQEKILDWGFFDGQWRVIGR